MRIHLIKKIIPFIASVIIFVLTFPSIGLPIYTGLDPSYIWALNYFFDKGIHVGKDIIFSYGPWGFTMFPQAIGNNLLYAIGFLSTIKFLFIYLALSLGVGIRKGKRFGILVPFIIVLIASQFMEYMYLFMYLIPFTVAVALLNYHESHKLYFLFIASFVWAFGSLTMMPNATTATSIILCFLVYLFLFERKTNLNKIALFIGSMGYFFLFFWLLANKSFSGIWQFFYSRVEIASGNSSAMVTFQNDNVLLVLGSLFFICIIPFLITNKRLRLVFLLFSASLFFVIKYAFSREDYNHVRYLLDYVFLFYLIVVLYLKSLQKIAIIFMILSLVLFGKNIADVYGEDIIGAYISRFNFSASVKNFSSVLFSYSELKKSLQNQSVNNIYYDILPEKIMQKVKNSTVDIYSYELAYIPANNLTYSPRPVIQTYHTFTSWLDTQNEQFFNSSRAPEYIIWPKNKYMGELDDIDTRYLPNDEPNTFMAIVNNYSVDDKEAGVTLLRRSQKANFASPITIKRETATFGEWIKVPQNDGGIMKMRISPKRTIGGKIMKTLLKEGESYVEYKGEDSVDIIHRLVIDTAVNGLWVSPYLSVMSQPLQGTAISEVKITTRLQYVFQKEFTVEWIYYPFAL